jgi:hypothetical protein
VGRGVKQAERSVRPATKDNRSRLPEVLQLFTVILVYDEAGNMIETHKHKGDFKEL